LAPTPEEALERIGIPKGTVAITVPDNTRDIDVAKALKALAAWLNPDSVTSVIVGLGLHRKLSRKELKHLTGQTKWKVSNHNADNCVTVNTIQGVPIQINPELISATTIITVGKIELHQYAGFSGGYKGPVVGCGGRRTIAALHHRDIVCDDSVRVGRLKGNLFRSIIDEAGASLGHTIALQQVGDLGWCAGDPVKAISYSSEQLASWEYVNMAYESVIVRIPDSKQTNFYQASRGATYLALSDHPPLKMGAHIIVDARCEEGPGLGEGERAFANVMKASMPKFETLLKGTAPTGGGTQRAIMIAKLLERYSLTVANCLEPEALIEIGIDATSDPPEALVGHPHLTIENPFSRLPQLKR